KKGHFLHAGVPAVGTYTVIVSAPSCEPFFQTGIRPGGDPIKVELRAGDGRKPTLAEVKAAQGSAGGGQASQPASQAEAKKQAEEYEKKRTEVDAQNKKNQAEFENMKKLFDSGLAKMNAKDYPGAVTDLTEASKIDAEQYSVWANLALALYNRGVVSYNESLKDATKRDLAKQDFNDAVSAIGKAISLTEAKVNDPAKGAEAKKQLATAIKIKADSEGLLAKKLGVMDIVDQAVKDYRQVADMSEAPADKVKFQLAAAEVYFDAGKPEEAVTAYTAILEAHPDNIDAIYKLGLAYASVAKFQESANTFQKFLDKAPETDARVPEVKTVLKDLIVGNNLQPPKSEGKSSSKGGSKGRKP